MINLIDKTTNSLYTCGTIALKDIIDSLRNRLIISMILGLIIMLVLLKIMPLIITTPNTEVVIYDAGDSSLVDKLENSSLFRVHKANSLPNLLDRIGSTGGFGARLGLVIPADFDQNLNNATPTKLEGFLPWTYRTKSDKLKTTFEQQISEVAGNSISIVIQDTFAFPSSGDSFMLGFSTWSSVSVILIMGISLVPTLLFEEKENKTMDALLVSPASIGQVVVGKAIAGLFYMLVTATVVFGLNWTGVVHWKVAILFTIISGFFGVSVGLIIGSFFKRQQDATGLSMFLIVLLIGTIFVDLIKLDLPIFVQEAIPLVPSVAMTKIIQFSFLERAPWAQIIPNLASIGIISSLLYAIVIWRILQSDR